MNKIKKLLFLIILLLPVIGYSATTDTLTKNGITWNFDSQVEYGTFANGDYWVVHPVTIDEVLPAATSTRHGWEVNPSAGGGQGFDGRADSFGAENMPSLPWSSNGTVQSVVKGISVTGDDVSPYLQTIAVLTVLPSTPPNNGAYLFVPQPVGQQRLIIIQLTCKPIF